MTDRRNEPAMPVWQFRAQGLVQIDEPERQGLTIREWFVGQAFQAINDWTPANKVECEEMAERVVWLADAVIKELEK